MPAGKRSIIAPLVVVLILGSGPLLSGCDSGSQAGPSSSQASAGTAVAGQSGSGTANAGGAPAPDATGVAGGQGADAGSPTAVLSAAGLDEEQTVSLYARVVAVLVSREVTSTEVIISPYIGQGEHLDNPDEETPIPDQLLPTLKQNDSAHSFKALDLSLVIGPLEEGGKVRDGGTYVTLGPITNDPDPDTFHVRASVYWNVGHGSGSSYTLKRDASLSSGWKLVTVEQEWSDNN